MITYTATYSPDDNKLRLYASSRLDADTYARVKALGFKWAPKQELFVAPAWHPDREDQLLELAGEIVDEDTSLVDRAEQRADRFDGFSERRAKDAQRARAAVDAIADNIPFGQPILVGHHSERHARKHAEKIERGMERAVKMWETSEYWAYRAAGAIAHAKYKERPDVRARRIKTIEAEKRKAERDLADAIRRQELWSVGGITLERALAIANTESLCSVQLENGEQHWSAWSALDRGLITPEEVQRQRMLSLPKIIARYYRWIQHYENRLVYERAMLAESGYIEPPKVATKAVLPILNYPGQVNYRNPYHKGEIRTDEAVGITKAELSRINKDYKGTKVSADGTHRIRTALIKGQYCIVYLTDSKITYPPGHEKATEATEKRTAAAKSRVEKSIARNADARAANRALVASTRTPVITPDPEREAMSKEMDALKRQAKAGVQVVSAEQLFPTPPHIVTRMIELAAIEPGMRVLEPSAGTGRILDQLPEGCAVVAVEINHSLCGRLVAAGRHIVPGDFMHCTVDSLHGQFDRILMNPPFSNADDIKHIKHAMSMLKEGGRLVAICAGGPRQERELMPLAGTWEQLPDDTFASEGTGVRTVLMTYDACPF